MRGTDPASRRPGRGWCRRSRPDWPRIHSRRDLPARVPGPQCVPTSIARSDTGPRCSGTGQTICFESRGSAAGRMSERIDPEKPERDRIGARTRNGADRRTGANLRRRGRRRGTRWPLDRGLCRIGGSLGDRLRRARLRWTSWSERTYRELSRFSNRHFWPGAHCPRLCPGAEIRRQDGDTERSDAPRSD